MTVTASFVLQGVDPKQIAAAPFDVQVVETTSDSGVAFTAAQVKQMESGGSQVLGYFSLGQAEDYRDYFQSLSKSVLGPLDPNWAGDYQVAFWTPEWKAVAQKAIDNMISAGYNGIFFDMVDAYQTSWATSHDANAEQDMVNLITSLKDYATSKNPNFKVWVNGAEELLDHSDYLGKIDGLVKEEVYYTDTGSKQPVSVTQYVLNNLEKAVDAGKSVVTIEYVTGATKIADVHAQAARDHLGSYVGNLALTGVDYDGVLPGQTVHPVGIGGTSIDTSIDTPTVALTHDTGTPGDLITNNAALTFSTAAADVTRSFKIDGASSAGYTAPTANGAHTVVVTDTDIAGNVATNSITFTLDKTIATPTAALTSDTGTLGDLITNNAALTFSKAAADVIRSFTIDGASSASYKAPTANGAHTVVVTDTDTAGNMANTSISFTLDKTIATPTAALTNDTGTPGDLITSNAALTFSKAAADVIRSFTIDGASSASYTALTTNGAHTVAVTDTDIAGNTATNSISFTLSAPTPVTPTPPATGSGSGTVGGSSGGTSGSTGGTSTSGSPDPTSGGGSYDWHQVRDNFHHEYHGQHWHW